MPKKAHNKKISSDDIMSDTVSDEAVLTSVRKVFHNAGCQPVVPPMLQPLDAFLDLLGEDIRHRLYMVTGDGEEACLRPDMTIPTCRLYLESYTTGEKAHLCYEGTVFRQQPDGSERPTEFLQTGIECLGDGDREAMDAEVMALAVDAVKEAGLPELKIEMGDLALFDALVEALELPHVWGARLRRYTRNPSRFREVLATMASDKTTAAEEGFLQALASLDGNQAQRLVQDILGFADIGPLGGRTIDDIAERFLEQAVDNLSYALPEDAAVMLSRFLEISGPPEEAVKALRKLCARTGVALDKALDALERRLSLVTERGISLKRARFSAEFGRNLDYYSGFVFELQIDKPVRESRVLGGGGRYDRLLTVLGSPEPVPAVGCTLRPDRITLAIKKDA
ncbi:MAG: ATP phosphoribosyltransferase regulatory subunit [Parvularculales bacterium]